MPYIGKKPADIIATAVDTTTGTFSGDIDVKGAAVFNEDSADVDFRVESDGNANMLFVDGGTDAVIIGHNASRQTLFNTTATAALQIEGTTANTASMLIARNSNNDNGPQLVFAKSNGTANGAVTVVTNSALLGRISFQGADGTHTVEGARIEGLVDGTPGANDMPGRLLFSTTADGAATVSERMRIDSSGNVGIGESAPDVKLEVDGGIKIRGTNYLSFTNTSDETAIRAVGSNVLGFYTDSTERMRIDATGNITFGGGGTSITAPNPGIIANNAGKLLLGKNNSNDDSSFLDFRRNGTVIGRVLQNGTTGVTYETSSDYRLKENVVTSWDATTRLKQLKPSRFNFISEADRTVDGFLAHEVQEIVPEAISGTKDGLEVWREGEELPNGVSVGDNKLDDDGNTIPLMQGIDQSKLVPLLVKTIQELEARLTAGGL